MESLLSVAFDNISAREAIKIRKGLKQIEGLLAHICLPRPTNLSPHKRKSSVLTDQGQPGHRQLSGLHADPAFKEFYRLQDSFQWNIASRLVATLERLLGMSSTSQTDLIILSALDVLQGILILHPPSRSLFSRELYMNLILDLLDAANPPKIQSQAVLVLVTALLDCPRNTRVFERIDGLLCLTSLFKSRGTTKEVKMRTLEFLYFYLMPEGPGSASSDSSTTVAQLGAESDKSFSRHAKTFTEDGGGGGGGGGGMVIDDNCGDQTRAMEDKQELLGRHLNNVAELVADIRETSPFGAMTA